MSTATKESPMSTATEAVQNEAAATDAVVQVTETVVAAWSQTSTVASAIVTGTTEVLNPARAVRWPGRRGSCRRFRRGGQEGCRIDDGRLPAGHQAATRPLHRTGRRGEGDWVSELTRRNALVIGELVAVYASATHDLLK